MATIVFSSIEEKGDHFDCQVSIDGRSRLMRVYKDLADAQYDPQAFIPLFLSWFMQDQNKNWLAFRTLLKDKQIRI